IDESHAPHLVYLPEVPFDTSAFLASVDRVVTRLGWGVVVVPEGLRDAAGRPVYEESAASQRDALDRALPGGVGNHLANVVTREWIDEASDLRIAEPFRKYLQACAGELVEYAFPLMDTAPPV